VFLDSIERKNPGLIQACIRLHQENRIPANSYVLDLDAIRRNAALMMAEARRLGLKVFAMTKQVGRNPALLQVLRQEGVDGCVCVDMGDARAVHAAGMTIGHLGHLVQVPKAEVAAAVAMKPLYWTVYSLEKAREISLALPEGQTQEILLRVYAEGDTFYPGHEGGFPAEEAERVIEELQRMPGLRFAGLTTFPTQLYRQDTGAVEHTHNYQTLLSLARRLEQKLGRKLEINAPGTTSSFLFEEMAVSGVTQVEPGHGLTGTCPQHALGGLAEKPAMAYVSEVSHLHQGKAYCFGGGMYIDPVFPPYQVQAFVGNGSAPWRRIACDIPKPESIDYYGVLQTTQGDAPCTGDTVVFGFRAQAFVTRAYVVPVAGIEGGSPEALGVFTSEGREVGWPEW
jgi:predicted amino acid racemase